MNHASRYPELLRQARVARSWTQQEAADRVRRACPGDHGVCKLNADRYAAFEDGLAHPGRLHTQAICQVFQMDPAELGLGDEPSH